MTLILARLKNTYENILLISKYIKKGLAQTHSRVIWEVCIKANKKLWYKIHQTYVNPLCANPTKWPNTLKQFVGKLPTNCLSVFDHFVKLSLKVLTAMRAIFDNYCAYMTHIESLSQTDFQPQKLAELSGFYKSWTEASILM